MSLFRRICSYGGLIAVLFLAAVGPTSASTNSFGSKFITSITYMNVGTAPANLSVKFVDSTGAIINYPILDADGTARTLAVNASASLAVSVLPVASTTGAGGSWKSGAVINANQPLVTTMVQVSTNPVIRVRPVSNGFRSADADNIVSLPYVLKACTASSLTTRFNAQNIGPSSDDITITLYWPNGDVAATISETGVGVGEIVAVDMSAVAITAPTTAGYTVPARCQFEGSAIISATTAKLVATAFEASTTARDAASYESSKGDTTIYMPSVLCNVNYGDGAQTSVYVVHNAKTSASPTISVTFKYAIRQANGSLSTPVQTLTRSIGALAQYKTTSINACTYLPANAVGSATITATKASPSDPTPIVSAISRINGTGVSAVAPGVSTTEAGTVAYAPYVRYSTLCFTATPTNAACRNESRQRTLFSVQNTSTSPSDDIRVKVTLYNHLGVAIGSFTSGLIKPGAKVSISPADVTAVATSPNNEFGYWVVGSNIVYGGSAKFESWNASSDAASTVPIATTVRVLNSTALGQTAEDYNGLAR